MLLLLIDDQGELWRGDSRRLREAFDSPYSGGEFVEYAIKNLGFIAINVFGDSCQARIRPDFVAENALHRLATWLDKANTHRIVLSTYKDGWHDQLMQPRNIATKLNELIQEKRRPEKQPCGYLTRSVSYDVLETKPVLRDIVQAWPHLVSNYDVHTLIRVARYALGDRYAVIKHSPKMGKLVFHEISDQIYSACDTWRTCAVGAPIEEQPDRAYGRWVSKYYYEAMVEVMPRLDAVDAIINNPQSGRWRWRYRRLVFPIQRPLDGPLLVGGSIIDQSIDLRIGSS